MHSNCVWVSRGLRCRAYPSVTFDAPPFLTSAGSTLMAFPCLDCRDCGTHMNPRYNPAASSTSSAVLCGTPQCSGGGGCGANNKCQYSQSYAEGSSLSGFVYTDSVYIGDNQDDITAATHRRFGLDVRILF